MIGPFLVMFGLSRWKVYAAIVAAFGVIVAWGVWTIKSGAQQDLLRQIERNESNARTRAVEGARSVDMCFDAGGVWDLAAGACRLPRRRD